MNQINVKINGADYAFDQPYTIIQACEIIGIEIPRFCYHKRLKIAGNCRMCLVELVGAPKPVAACAINIANNMNINTNNEKVEKMRQAVMEFLLINHPLDCPICDQGGECDLQDQALKYGRGYSRFCEDKRVVEEKSFGPLIKTHMTRCIQCMRCVRFMRDVAGVNELGTMNRGEDLEIVNAIDDAVRSEVSGNIIDLCPVGALTNRPYAYTARPWELVHVPSIDIMDGMGCNIYLDVRGKEVMRILPRENDAINEEWISDKTRFHYDGLKYQRLSQPYLRNEEGKLKPITWKNALEVAINKISSADRQKMMAIAGQTADCDSMWVLKRLFTSLRCYNLEFRQDGSFLPVHHKNLCFFAGGFESLEEADVCLIIGANIRYSAPVLNLRLNRLRQENDLAIFMIGNPYELNYSYNHLGQEAAILEQIANGEHEFCQVLARAKKPVLILGTDLLKSSELAEYSFYYAAKIAQSFNFIQYDENGEMIWNGFNTLGSHAQRGGALLMDFMPGAGIEQDRAKEHGILNLRQKRFELLYLLNADELPADIEADFIIYQGHHGDQGAHRADLILPGLAYSEKEALYANIEARVQKAHRAIQFPFDGKKDDEIIKEIGAAILGGDFADLDVRAELAQYHQAFQVKNYGCRLKIDFIHNFNFEDEVGKPIYEGLIGGSSNKPNFYQTNSIARNSSVMRQCMQQGISFD